MIELLAILNTWPLRKHGWKATNIDEHYGFVAYQRNTGEKEPSTPTSNSK